MNEPLVVVVVVVVGEYREFLFFFLKLIHGLPNIVCDMLIFSFQMMMMMVVVVVVVVRHSS